MFLPLTREETEARRAGSALRATVISAAALDSKPTHGPSLRPSASILLAKVPAVTQGAAWSPLLGRQHVLTRESPSGSF